MTENVKKTILFTSNIENKMYFLLWKFERCCYNFYSNLCFLSFTVNRDVECIATANHWRYFYVSSALGPFNDAQVLIREPRRFKDVFRIFPNFCKKR